MDDFIENLYEEWIDEFNLTPLTTERFSEIAAFNACDL